ncbi:MAG: PAS domain S-box protein [Candidatus Heimdallarchaeota archaeon]|nr:PAS domain S-box protein [Candidatus Heimdallarchaeota archaeon]MBY8994106.1 PAS domain S-box protein [Candidatus Heimdallarchaeota archaeon]
MKSKLDEERDFKTHPILEKILTSSGWYKTLVDTMPEGIVASDMNFNIIYVNPKICKMLGYTEDELLGKNSIDIVMESDRNRVTRESEKRLTEKKTSQYEITFKSKLGSKVPVLISGTPLLGPDGESIGTYAIITDISDRKIVERELRNKNVELQTLYNNLLELYEQLASIIADTTTIYTEIYLFTSKDCVYCAPAEEVLQEVLASYGGKITYRKVDIDEEPELAEKYDIMSLPTIAIGDEQLTSVPDMYKLHSALFSALVPEEKFRRTRQELDNIIENSPIAILTINNKGILTGLNPLVEILTDKKRADLVGSNFLKSTKNDKEKDAFPKSLIRLFNKGLSGEKVDVNRLKIKNINIKHPEPFTIISLKVVPMANKEGEITEILALCEDVTILALQEEELATSYTKLEELNEKLLELNRERSNFMEVTSTGLLDPLRSSKELLDQILSGRLGELNEEVFGTIEYLRNNLANVSKSILDILDHSTLETQGYTLKPKLYKIRDIVSESLTEVGSVIIDKGFFVTYDIPDKMSAWCDKEQAVRIIKNLVLNAIKFTEKDSKIHIVAKELKKDFIEISVIDNGMGISKKDLQRIFEQYVKVDSKSLGSGLGLAVVKSLVEAHGGAIIAESEGKSKGSTFKFTLPKNKKIFEQFIKTD